MARTIIDLLRKDDWLIGDDSRQLAKIAEELYLTLTIQRESPAKILLVEREPIRFLAAFIAACAADCQVFLANPDWGKSEWRQVLELVQPDLIWGVAEWGNGGDFDKTSSIDITQLPSPPLPSPPYPLIMIPTGGSSGEIKFAIHTWETLTASVRGFATFFQKTQINSFCVLPLYHVSGLMQFMRSLLTGGQLAIVPFKDIHQNQKSALDISDFLISLVPTQLQQLLQSNSHHWLSKFSTVLLGGAPAWTELLEQAKAYKIRLAPTYGMTETASAIAILKPDDFLNGQASCGQILPQAKVTILNIQGEILNPSQVGNLKIQSKSLTLGYYPHRRSQDYLQLDDLGYFDEHGYLHIIGRDSDKIITGGENVYPAEIESAIRSTQMVTDVCVIGITDKYWGQAVTAFYVHSYCNTSTDVYREVSEAIATRLKEQLSKFKIPKYWIPLSTLPRNSQGKINRQQLRKIAEEWGRGGSGNVENFSFIISPLSHSAIDLSPQSNLF